MAIKILGESRSINTRLGRNEVFILEISKKRKAEAPQDDAVETGCFSPLCINTRIILSRVFIHGQSFPPSCLISPSGRQLQRKGENASSISGGTSDRPPFSGKMYISLCLGSTIWEAHAKRNHTQAYNLELELQLSNQGIFRRS